MAKIGNMIATLSVDIHLEKDLVSAFNLWMDEYMNNPEEFKKTQDSAVQHLQEKLNGEELTYGQEATATLMSYIKKTKLNNQEK